ncbi:MAG: Ni/Fe-hydrogenase cytochrome b subunit [Candidatus Omnitrophota bacterium]|jgi:Ni/Fe-hydrogenase subunit HybB-like protein|nr:MAG: Ni/Fe-hydrogenase cytochrome b subunit [Candidatus Omnitrophota bacterium]
MDRVRRFKLLLWSICGLAFAVAFRRFLLGLGSSTNLNDGTPWGLWVGFDVMGGVALAAGGFVITATVYILKKEEFHPIVRPAVLTAFLGYAAVAVGLLADLGLPWHIWHPTIYWQHHSALFEVAWCVMLYLTVLALEFLPVPLESFPRLGKIRNFLVKNRLILVILGIMLSTLHQSSLGTLFLIMPYRLHALWYTPILPLLFFISAISLGLMMVSMESLITSYLYRREPETHLLTKLCKVAAWVLGGYLIVRILDLLVRGEYLAIFENSWQSWWFIIEILISAIIPIVLFTSKLTRGKLGWITLGVVSGVSGFVLNRLNVGGIAMAGTTDSFYFPAWTEFAISAGVVSGAALVFLFAIEHFNVWEHPPRDEEDEKPYTLPRFAPVGTIWLGDPHTAGMKRNSMAFVVAAAFGFSLLPFSSLESKGLIKTPANSARGKDIMQIDANRDGFFVTFDHKKHENSLGQTQSCAVCHHAKLPADEQTSCAACHQDVYLVTCIFDHEKHKTWLGGNQSCTQCHPAGQNRSVDTAVECNHCHNAEDASLVLAVQESPIRMDQLNMAGSYVDAMHGLCVTCHKEIAERIYRPLHGTCTTCHPFVAEESKYEWDKLTQTTASPRWVISTPLLQENIDVEKLKESVAAQ